jgi:integrase
MNGINGTMVERVTRYVQWKRDLGFSLHGTAQELLRFARFADDVGHQGPLTTAIMLRWAQTAVNASWLYRARRLETVRTLARFEASFEPLTEIPQRNTLGHAHCRVQPFIFSEAEIEYLIEAAGRLTPLGGLRPRTYQTMIGLMASTGLRLCEALKLQREDFDPGARRLIIRETKFNKSRIVPLDDSVTNALANYADFRDTYAVRARTDRFLVSEQGREMKSSVVHYTFQKIRDCVALHGSSNSRKPRLYDLRHTFACRVIERWYKEGADVNQHLPFLSTYLGHVKPNDTYWYLSGIPELMEMAVIRFSDSPLHERGTV